MSKAYLETEEIWRLEQAATNLGDRLLVRVIFHLGCRLFQVAHRFRPVELVREAMGRSRILVVDDNKSTLDLLWVILEEDFDVFTAEDAISTMRLIKSQSPDLIILDIMLPEIDGFEICRMIRDRSSIPIIALSARCEPEDKIRCLNLGADDYVTKPFVVEELIARIRSALRRNTMNAPPPTRSTFKCSDLNIDFTARRVVLAGKELRLTPIEYNLLQELVLNAGKPLTYDYLLKKVLGPEYEKEKEYIHTYVKRLRSKIERDSENPRYIHSVSSVGYRFINTQ